MTGEFYLDWALMAVSLFNTVLLTWLGLTVVLNSERHTWGVWLIGGGLLLGGAFFVSHSAILGHGLNYVSYSMNFWWRIGWVPVVALPFVWYLIMLWYTGFWDARQSPLRRRQWHWFLLTVVLAITLIGLLLFANPLPSYSQVAQLKLATSLSIGGIPLLILVYPLYIILCIVLSLDALRRPEPSARLMGDLARRRARPWLVATSVVLLVVSLLVAWVMFWIIVNARQRLLNGAYPDMTLTVAWFDLVIASLIGVAIILQGQAIVAYELFTGRTLPRRGFQRQWRRAIILAVGYGIVIGWGLVAQLRPIYGLLMSAILMTLFFALLSWRSYIDRERYIEHLRPFVASQRLYEHLLDPSQSAAPDSDMKTQKLFVSLCQDVLETSLAYLIPWGSLAPLAGSVLVYPNAQPTAPPAVNELVSQFDSPQVMCRPLDPGHYRGAIWAVPLWSERGLIGILLLGKKRDGGLYTQEEIEIARASGERLVDTQASTEMGRRLMALQRQRLTQSQIIDRQTRRILHDDVLPQLHAAILALNNRPPHDQGTAVEVVSRLTDLHRQISSLLQQLATVPIPNLNHQGLIGTLQKVVTSELPNAFDEVGWHIEPEAAAVIQDLAPLSAEVLFGAAREVIRNAAGHGRGPDPARRLHLQVNLVHHDALTIEIEDDGVGLNAATGVAEGGHGQGLALHGTLMAVVGGSLSIESIPGAYTRVSLTLPKSI